MEGSHLIVFWNKVLVISKICEILFNIALDITWTNFWHGLHFYLRVNRSQIIFARQYFVPWTFRWCMCSFGIHDWDWEIFRRQNIYYSLTFTTISKLIFTDQFTIRDFYFVQNMLQYLKLYTFIFTHEEF